MEYVFFLLWAITIILIPIYGVKLIKLKLVEKNMVKEKEGNKSKLTTKQLKTFLIISVVTSLISFIGIGVTAPTMEQSNEINAEVYENIVEELYNEYANQILENVITTENNSNSNDTSNMANQIFEQENNKTSALSNIPVYSGNPYISINNNKPFFADSELTTNSYESYSSLDSLGRCGVAKACIGKDIMPTEEREDIGAVKPSGWHTIKYNGISGNYLYNRCHLIGFQLTGENDNSSNLITGTRYLNVEGMLPFENMVADFIIETNKHVLYRVTPVFEGNNLLASGVLIEAKSVEDNGEGIEFNVYCYNVQPGITINYSTGESSGPEYTGANSSSNSIVPNASKDTRSQSTSSSSATSKDTSKESNNLPSASKEANNETSSSLPSASKDTDNETITNLPSASNSSASKETSTNKQNGKTVYRTPTGKRYHLDPDCGGKNSYETTLDAATSLGLTPCKKCAQ